MQTCGCVGVWLLVVGMDGNSHGCGNGYGEEKVLRGEHGMSSQPMGLFWLAEASIMPGVEGFLLAGG